MVATAKYGALSESIRSSMAEARMCSMFCGGKSCKYESATKWKTEQQAITGLYSNWYLNAEIFFIMHKLARSLYAAAAVNFDLFVIKSPQCSALKIKQLKTLLT